VGAPFPIPTLPLLSTISAVVPAGGLPPTAHGAPVEISTWNPPFASTRTRSGPYRPVASLPLYKSSSDLSAAPVVSYLYSPITVFVYAPGSSPGVPRKRIRFALSLLPTRNSPDRVVRPVTPSVPPTVVFPVTPSVLLIVVAPVTPSVPPTVVFPVTPSVLLIVVAPVTPSVPPTLVFPVMPSVLLIVVAPVTPSVPPTVVFPVALNVHH
jgi:hypothetical protein